MIELKTIAKTIENNLNTLLANDGGQQFKIFADLGEFQNYYKAQNSNDISFYINGILEALTPSLLPIRNLQALTQTIRVTFALDVELMNKDENGNFKEVTGIRKILEKYIASANAKPFALSETLADSTSMTYEVTPSFNGVTVGEIAQLSPIGEILPMYLDCTYTFIQSGINSNSVQIFLNGESLYFEKCSLSRVRLAESNTFAGGKSTKTVIQNNGLSIDLNAPLLDTTQSGVIEDDVLDGGNNIAQCVQYVRGTKVRNYIMVFGNTTENLEMAKNIGANVSLVEGKQDILSYNEHWRTYSVAVNAGQTITIGTAVSEFDGVAFFGDGTSGTSTTGIFEHTYENAGTYIVRVFDYYNIKVVSFYVGDEVFEQQEVEYGEQAQIPTPAPQETGKYFFGWYKNAGLTTKFDFSQPILENMEVYGKLAPLRADLVIQAGTNTSLTITRTASPYGNAPTGELTNGAIVYNGDVLSISATRTNAEEKDLKVFAEIENTTVELFSGDEDTYTTTYTITEEWLSLSPVVAQNQAVMRISATTNNWQLRYNIGLAIEHEGETEHEINTSINTVNSIWKFSTTYNGKVDGEDFSGQIGEEYSVYNLELENIDLKVELERGKTNNAMLYVKIDQTIEDENEYIYSLSPFNIYRLEI